MNDIVVQGENGSIFLYTAVHGPEFSPEETGWVLVVENSPQPLDPQTLSAAEVLGDLRSMEMTSPPPEELVRFFTELMIESLARQVAELDANGRATGEGRARLKELRKELAALSETSEDRGPS